MLEDHRSYSEANDALKRKRKAVTRGRVVWWEEG